MAAATCNREVWYGELSEVQLFQSALSLARWKLLACL
jgi:hypothetical protein